MDSSRVTIHLGINGMLSQRNEQVIEGAIGRLPGVRASASFATQSLKVEFDRNQCAMAEIVRRLDELGFSLRPGGPIRAEEIPPPGFVSRCIALATARVELTCAVVGAVLLLGAAVTHWTGGPAALRFVLVGLSYVVAGWFTAMDTFRILRRLQFDIDVLMFAAAFGAAAIGHFEEGALLLVLFAFGGAGEAMAMDRARSAIEKLTKLVPDIATVRDANGRERSVRIEQLQVGDEVVVKPFERLPADGVVIEGVSVVDQSPITGESVPVEKLAGSNVFAGTINGQGLIVARVTKPSNETTLAKVIRMVNEAQASKSPTQLFTEQIEKRYVPVVLAATGLLIFFPPIVLDANWATWFYRAMAFLTAASPCALAIGTPAAVLCGIARAAQIGVLVKGGVHLENLGRVRAVAFDKTGTLTVGSPRVTRIISLDSLPDLEILSLAAAVDARSTHPAAAAIVAEARSRGLALRNADNVVQLAGRGAAGWVDGSSVYVGKLTGELLTDSRISDLASQGKMLAQVSRNEKPVGVIVLEDTPRPRAAESIAALHARGIRKCIMLTGDRAAVANPIARQLGIDDVHADLMPEDKLRLIGQLQKRHGPMAMVGDGVNDAPALAAASVGIAMGGAGTDVALETADVALMSDDLVKLPDAIGLSRHSRRVIKQNLVIALGVISVLAPLAALGYTYLGVAVLFHEGSTVVVVLNSMRLLLYNPRQ